MAKMVTTATIKPVKNEENNQANFITFRKNDNGRFEPREKKKNFRKFSRLELGIDNVSRF